MLCQGLKVKLINSTEKHLIFVWNYIKIMQADGKPKTKNISLPAYNGKRYIDKQLDFVLERPGEKDRGIVSAKASVLYSEVT